MCCWTVTCLRKISVVFFEILKQLHQQPSAQLTVTLREKYRYPPCWHLENEQAVFALVAIMRTLVIVFSLLNTEV